LFASDDTENQPLDKIHYPILNFCDLSRHFLAVYPVVFGVAIVISALSYRRIERYFLRRKGAHSYAQTG